jgi:hypothetical protein
VQVRLAMDVDGVVASLLVLRDAFPAANVSRMVVKYPPLLRLGRDELRASVEEARALAARPHPSAASHFIWLGCG